MDIINSNKNKSLKLFEGCFPVKGYTRSIICDTQRNKYDFITNELFTILTDFDGWKIEKILNQISSDSFEIFEEYLDFVLKKEYAFLTDHPEYFPKISQDWRNPSKVTNAIFDFGLESTHKITPKDIEELEMLGCKVIEFRYYFTPKLNDLLHILNMLKKSAIRGVQFYVKYDKEIGLGHWYNDTKDHKRINYILFHSCPAENEIDIQEEYDNFIFTPDIIKSEKDCGIVCKSNFSCSLEILLESKRNNSCLNKKISVDSNGEIKNCPSMTKSFGSLEETSLLKAYNAPDFKILWSVNKDKIKVCKDCEFRYMCVDCRAFTKDGDLYSKPAKCTYDPYTGVWDNKELVVSN